MSGAKLRCVKRLLLGTILALALFASTDLLPAARAGAQTTKAVQATRCSKATTGRANLTKTNVADCRATVLVQLRCDSGPSIGIVKVNGVAYALRQGSRPLRMGNNYRVIQLAKLCIAPAPPTTTTSTTTTIPPTTTTVTVPPTTTPPTVPPNTTPPTTAPPAPQPAAACTPMTDGGNCYEPGEYCRNSDHGASGTAGNGEAIVCSDNNGWRWEPA